MEVTKSELYAAVKKGFSFTDELNFESDEFRALFRLDDLFRMAFCNKVAELLLTDCDRTYSRISDFTRETLRKFSSECESLKVQADVRRLREALCVRMFNIACDLIEDPNLIGLVRIAPCDRLKDLYVVLGYSEVFMERLARAFRNSTLCYESEADDAIGYWGKILISIGQSGPLTKEVFAYFDGIMSSFDRLFRAKFLELCPEFEDSYRILLNEQQRRKEFYSSFG